MNVRTNEQGKIFYEIESNGGHLHERMLICHTSLAKVRKLTINELCHCGQENSRNKPTTGIQPDDLDIISTLEPQLVQDIPNHFNVGTAISARHLE